MECKTKCAVYMYCTLRTVVHFTWEMCALAVPLNSVQLGYKYKLIWIYNLWIPGSCMSACPGHQPLLMSCPPPPHLSPPSPCTHEQLITVHIQTCVTIVSLTSAVCQDVGSVVQWWMRAEYGWSHDLEENSTGWNVLTMAINNVHAQDMRYAMRTS